MRKGMGPSGMAEYMGKGRRFGPPPEVAAPPSEPEPSAPAAPVVSMVADLPFDEDSALEIKLKTDPEAARRYRSPRKAFFFSLLVPGAGQAYCGSWAKSALFVAAEIGLGVGWYQVAVVASRNKAREAERYAALHWRQQKYEAQWQKLFGDSSSLSDNARQGTAPWRESYCRSLYQDNSPSNLAACQDAPVDSNINYSNHLAQFGTGGIKSTDSGAWTQNEVTSFREANIKDLNQFHDLIGRYNEFTTGWEDDTTTITQTDLGAYYNALVARAADPTVFVPLNPWGVSQMQAFYRTLRTRSDDLARTQKYFMGGMILNHLVSALDAALQATRMNRRLLHLETTWLDRIELDGGLALVPQPTTHATLAWRF
jgi:hypothetical protein